MTIENAMLAEIDYDRFHAIVRQMYGGIIVAPPVKKGRK